MSIFGCNLNIECQVMERSLHSECGNILQAFFVAQWAMQANKGTVTTHGHIMIPEILSELLLTLVIPLICLQYSTVAQPCNMLLLKLHYRKTHQNTERDTITVYYTAITAIHNAIFGSNLYRRRKSTKGSHVCTCKNHSSQSSTSRPRTKLSEIFKIHLTS